MSHNEIKNKISISEISYVFLYRFIIILIVSATLYPIIFVLSSSLSSPVEVGKGTITLLPKGITFAAYKHVLRSENIWIGYKNTIVYTIFGTIFSTITTLCAAYALSKPRLRGRSCFMFLFAFTMWFQGGMIPTYLVIKDLGLLNNRWVMILPGLCGAYYMILMRTYFQSVPSALEESAKIDGANDLYIMFKIFIPLSIPAIVTIALYYAVIKWNAWFHAMLYLSDESKYPLQLFLRRILTQARMTEDEMAAIKKSSEISAETIQYATILVVILPMMTLYPFVQKYFVKGVMIGSIKG